MTYLVSALTGHVEGSRAFTRYRTIDIDMKKDIVKILEGKWKVVLLERDIGVHETSICEIGVNVGCKLII